MVNDQTSEERRNRSQEDFGVFNMDTSKLEGVCSRGKETGTGRIGERAGNCYYILSHLSGSLNVKVEAPGNT